MKETVPNALGHQSANLPDGYRLVEFRIKNRRRDLVPGLLGEVSLSPDNLPAAPFHGEIDDEGRLIFQGLTGPVIGSGEGIEGLDHSFEDRVGLIPINDLDPSIPNKLPEKRLGELDLNPGLEGLVLKGGDGDGADPGRKMCLFANQLIPAP